MHCPSHDLAMHVPKQSTAVPQQSQSPELPELPSVMQHTFCVSGQPFAGSRTMHSVSNSELPQQSLTGPFSHRVPTSMQHSPPLPLLFTHPNPLSHALQPPQCWGLLSVLTQHAVLRGAPGSAQAFLQNVGRLAGQVLT